MTISNRDATSDVLQTVTLTGVVLAIQKTKTINRVLYNVITRPLIDWFLLIVTSHSSTSVKQPVMCRTNTDSILIPLLDPTDNFAQSF